ncbi:DUF4282 domain-containing protein [Parvularcula maris]|uniref:DUF4282 domain-containing protein n=1 Tax=Parvularcula maris TaxID=2965077 RepID=A0A9X2L6A4_9PROT|nr:DUF4282 domain-containing protein [Parvularcula maris]MCQ8183830.1 DUF4282 domain-containing protein [Parvularcula maris]
MSELVGRFLSFEDHLGRGLVKFVYYVLLFLLVITTLFELVTALIGMFNGEFWASLWAFLVLVPLNFFVRLLLLRVGAELVIAILSIDDNLRGESSADTISTGLNPVTPPRAAPTMTAPITPSRTAGSTSEKRAEAADEEAADAPPTPTKAAKKRPPRKRTKKAAGKTAALSEDTAPASPETKPVDPAAEPDETKG